MTSARAITLFKQGKGERLTMAKGTKAAAPVEEVDDDDLEEVSEDTTDDDDEAEAPAKGKAKKAAEPEVFGVRALIALVKEKTGKDYKPREVRTQLRAMARAGTIEREIIPGNKARYEWPEGANDAEVKAFIKAVKSGAIEETKKAALAKLKSDKAAKDAAKSKSEKATKGKKAAPAADDDEDED